MSDINLSILIPSYNFKLGIEKIIECLLSIDYDLKENIEIIISDDSDNNIINDKTRTELLKKFKSFHYIYNKKPYGGVKNWNKLISKANGNYIWVLHHDEYWDQKVNLINYIFEIIQNKNPELIILPIQKEKKIFFNNHILQTRIKNKILDNIFEKFISNSKFLLKLNIIGPPSTLIYKNKKIFYDKNLQYFVDCEFYIRLFAKLNISKIFHIKKIYYLKSSQNNSNSITKKLKKSIRNIKKKEKEYIQKKHQLKFRLEERLFIFCSFIIFKIYSLFTIRFKIFKS